MKVVNVNFDLKSLANAERLKREQFAQNYPQGLTHVGSSVLIDGLLIDNLLISTVLEDLDEEVFMEIAVARLHSKSHGQDKGE